MEDVFIADDFDGHLTLKIKTEANIKIASVLAKKDFCYDDGVKASQELHRLIAFAKTLDYHNTTTDLSMVDILNTMIKFIETGILSLLTLNDNEFKEDNSNENLTIYENIRYPYISRYDNEVDDAVIKSYVNQRAFTPVIKASYNSNTNQQINILDHYIMILAPQVYITKGGVVTGEYIKLCYINMYKFKQKDNNFDLTIPIKLPVSVIYNNKNYIYTVDVREPKLTELNEHYTLEMAIDNDIKSKYDIRKYIKLIK